MSDKTKYPRAIAIAAVKEILAHFNSSRLVIAGSLRRGKDPVGDIEIVYIPNIITRPDPSDLFTERTITENQSSASIQTMMLNMGIIRARKNLLGSFTWGDKNKLAVHAATGIPVDFFATTEAAWWNYLVCRTGSAETNTRIATAAQRKGWKWHPYSTGFTDASGQIVPALSERAVFELAGLPYLEPWER